MIVYHHLSYAGMPQLFLPWMTTVSDALGTGPGNWPVPEIAAQVATTIPAGWVVIDSEDGTWGAKYSVIDHPVSEVREFTLKMRETIDAMKQANPRLYFGIYSAHLTDQNGPLYLDQSSPDAAVHRQAQTTWNASINKSRVYKDGTGLLPRLDATVLNLYAGEGQAANGRGLAGIIADNAEIFRKMGRPRIAFISPDRQRAYGADGDSRFLPWAELETQLNALTDAGVEMCVLWGGYGFQPNGAAYVMNWTEWPADTRRKLNEWLKDHGSRLELVEG